MTIRTYERSARSDALVELIEDCPRLHEFERIIIFPIPTTRDGEHINGSEEKLSDAIKDAKKGVIVAGYGIPPDISGRILDAGARVCDSLYDEEFLLENATLTALATLGIILTEETRSPKDLKVGIVGYGRIGRELTRMLIYTGAAPTVFTSRKSVCLELCECGVRAQMNTNVDLLKDLDILINTAPAPVFGMESADFPAALTIIDLASGTNFPPSVGAKKYPSLPAKFYPYSAGHAWFNSIKRCILGAESFISGE